MISKLSKGKIKMKFKEIQQRHFDLMKTKSNIKLKLNLTYPGATEKIKQIKDDLRVVEDTLERIESIECGEIDGI